MDSTLYWARIREQDGSWTDWRQVDRDYFERVHGRYEFDTCTTPAHPPPHRNPPTMSESKTDWRPMNTAPRDGTEIRLLWIGGEDEGHWRPFTSPEQVWKECPWHHGQSGEWSTRYGNATGDEVEPQGWLPMEPSHAHP